MKDLHLEKYKTLFSKIEDLNKSRDIQCPWTRRLNIIKILILLKIDPIKQSWIKILINFTEELDTLIWNFIPKKKKN